jgi:hypothetical protein
MKWIMLGLVLAVLVQLSSVQALIITPDSFSSDVEHGGFYANHFRIIPENISQDINLYSSSPFPVIFNSTHLLNLSTYYDMDFNISVPQQFPEGLYNSYLFVVGDNQTKVVNVVLNIKKNLNFTVESPGNVTIGTGETGFITLKVKNTGNEKMQIDMSISSNYVSMSFDNQSINDFVLYPNISVQLPLNYHVPENLPEKIYDANITVSSRGQNASYVTHLNFSVVDVIPPEITKIVYNETWLAGVDLPIKTEVHDNLNVSKVNIKCNITNSTQDMSGSGSIFSSTFNIKTVGDANCIINATDVHGNRATGNFSFTVLPYNNVNLKLEDYKQINKDELFKFEIFESNISVPFCFVTNYIDFINYNAALENPYDFFLYVDDIKQTIRNENVNLTNQTITKCFEGKHLQFAFKAEDLGRLDMEFVVGFPAWVGSNVTMNIGTNVDDRTIKKQYVLNMGDTIMVCNYTTAVWECQTNYSVAIDLEKDLGRPMTEREYNTILDSANQTAQRLEVELGYSNGINLILWIIVIIGGIGAGIYYLFAVKGFQLQM